VSGPATTIRPLTGAGHPAATSERPTFRFGAPDLSLPFGAENGDPQHRYRVGVDLVAVADVAASVAQFGDRYLQRIFTPHEVASCRLTGGQPGLGPAYSFDSLAARFAAKEATVKVLRPVGARPEWRTIEVRRRGSGWVEIRLTGRAAELAIGAGIEQFAVSLTHEASMAAAVVVGVGPSPGWSQERSPRSASWAGGTVPPGTEPRGTDLTVTGQTGTRQKGSE
jgi:holo-[acyl-carrier protein] synthase